MTIRDISVAFGFDVDRASQQQAENSIKGIKNMATKLLGKIAVVFSVAKLTSFAKDCVEAASNVEEMENKSMSYLETWLMKLTNGRSNSQTRSVETRTQLRPTWQTNRTCW